MTQHDLMSRVLAAVPRLPRPVVLLEDGVGRTGTARLVWGARTRFRLPWSPAHMGDVDALRKVAMSGQRAYGVIAYDAGLPPRARRSRPIVSHPLVDLFVPEREIVLDLGAGRVLSGEMAWVDEAEGADVTAGDAAGPTIFETRSFTEATFARAVCSVRELIAAGEVYQVNLAVAEAYRVGRSPWVVYQALRRLNPSPWMGFADFGDWQLVSGSPELLAEVRPQASGGWQIRTRPIAGTRKKTGDARRDAAMRSELRLDAKEQAEHRMLLDLARNDVGRVARFGTVRVSEREVIEEYSHVFHLVSEVQADLDSARAPWELVPAMFPAGTITGAPKIRAMEVIADLEPVARGAYTGALGWLGPDEMQFNIVIRSAVLREGLAVVQAGAGIVWDSDPLREWRESLRKGEAMRLALGVSPSVPVAAMW